MYKLREKVTIPKYNKKSNILFFWLFKICILGFVILYWVLVNINWNRSYAQFINLTNL